MPKMQSNPPVFAPFFYKKGTKDYAGDKVLPAPASIYKLALANSTYRHG